MSSVLDEIVNQIREDTEKHFAESIQKYDFIVGSFDTYFRLKDILPEEMTVIRSPYIKDRQTVYAIKKINIADLEKEVIK